MIRVDKWRPYVVTLISVILGAAFLFAGVIKVRDPQGFADQIYAYDILPRILINPVAVGLPILEIIIGAMLLFGIARRFSAGVTMLLCGIFLFALSQAQLRGLSIDCGCFGNGESFGSSIYFAIGRDIGLLCAAIFIFRVPRPV